jgi:hypothetical protein
MKKLLAMMAVAALTACGGGGDDDGASGAIPELAPYVGTYTVKVAPLSSNTGFSGRAGQNVTLSIHGNQVVIDGQAFTWDGVGDAVTNTQSIGANPQPMVNIKVDGANNSWVSVDFLASKSLSNVILYQPIKAASLFGGYATFVP